MPQRVIYLGTIVLGIVGLAVIGVLLVLRRDVWVAAETGHPWKRRLLMAAIMLLASAGLYSGYELHRVASQPDEDNRMLDHLGGLGLADTPHWRRVTETWGRAEEIASGRKGSYPFTARQRQQLLRDLRARGGDVGELAAAGVLSPAEAGLLENGLRELASGVGHFRSVEDMGATCYSVSMEFAPAEASLTHLADQVALLSMLAESGRVSPAVVAKVVPQIEADLKEIDKSRCLEFLAEERKQLAAVTQPDESAKWRAGLLAREPFRSADQTVERTRQLLSRIKGQPSPPASQPDGSRANVNPR